MTIQLSDHFTYKKLISFVLPSCGMMLFTSVYGVVDGLFVSNFVGKTPFAAINLIMPFIMLIGAVGFMLGAGGSALVSRLMGMGDGDGANHCFSMIVTVTFLSGVLFSALGFAFMPHISVFLGAEGEMLGYCVQYGRLIFAFNTAFMLQQLFQTFFVTAEKPKLGFYFTVAAGVSNMLLDALFVAVLKWGVAGAAVATGISQCVGGVLPLFYFIRKNTSRLRFRLTAIKLRPILTACGNGSSEMLNNVSVSILGMVYNFQLLKYAGENGVAAYGVLMYIGFIFVAVFIGYAIGSAPIIGYHYGAENKGELYSMLRKSMILMGGGGIVLSALAFVASPLVSHIFVGYDSELLSLTRHAFRVYSFSFILTGMNIFISAFFTALSNGAVSAIVSFMRTLVFQLSAVLLLPLVFDIDGIWWAVITAELCAFIISCLFLAAKSKKYGYTKKLSGQQIFDNKN